MSRLVAIFTLFAALHVAEAQTKKRVAILNFDYATVHKSVSAWFGTDQDVGKGIADLLVDRLVSDGVFSVIERNKLDQILKEQNFSNSDRADASSAAKIGRVLGVEAIIIGSITEFGMDDKKTTAGGGIRALSKVGLGGVQTSNASAVVQVTARMINTTTAEILASAQGRGQKSRKGAGLAGGGGGVSGAAAGALDMRSSNFRETIIGEATNDAVTQLAQGLEQKASSLPAAAPVRLEGRVADVSGDTLIINIGGKAGVKKGDKLDVTRVGREIKDPDTGKTIRRVEDPVGSIVITDVDEVSAVGKFSGAGKPQNGDRVASPK
jgi:curli biogenesis system outer membrane secretion channel CsgG